MLNRSDTSNQDRLVSSRVLIASLVTGGAALIIVAAHFTIPIPGVDVVTDPREIFTTVGASLAGPVGGVIVGLMAGAAVPGTPLASVLAHVLGGIWMGYAYKKLLHRSKQTVLAVLGWIGLVVSYYYIFLIPGFWAGLVIFYGDRTPFFQMYARVALGAIQEVILTVLITALAMIALPKKYRRPVW